MPPSWSLFLGYEVLRQRNTIYKKKGHFWRNSMGVEESLFWKAVISGSSEAGLSSENRSPLPKSVEFSLSCPHSGAPWGSQAVLGAHYQMESSWSVSLFMPDFTTDRVHCSWNAGLPFPIPHWPLVPVAVQGRNCLCWHISYSFFRVECPTPESLAMETLKCMTFWLLIAHLKGEELWYLLPQGKWELPWGIQFGGSKLFIINIYNKILLLYSPTFKSIPVV